MANTISSKVRIAVLVVLMSLSTAALAASPDVKADVDDQLTTDGDGNLDSGDIITYQGEGV